VSRYLGWIAEERRGHRESAVGAVIVKRADAKLRYAVKANRATEPVGRWPDPHARTAGLSLPRAGLRRAKPDHRPAKQTWASTTAVLHDGRTSAI